MKRMYIQTYIYIFIYICIYTHTHTHTHTYIYIHVYCTHTYVEAFLGGNSGKEPACQSRRGRRCEFDPCICKIPGEGNGQPPVFLPGKFHGQRSMSGYSLRDCKESGTTELSLTHTDICRVTHHGQVGFIPAVQGQFNICKTVNVIHHVDRKR